ncbi:transcription elongation factor GreA [Streptomyces sp. NPDC058279]|uniref:transcription elongation factor GreA n=1 Tax=Streptomyces sp. NPDC058279 TaxID=3346418 RepID=UPI0036E7F9E8
MVARRAHRCRLLRVHRLVEVGRWCSRSASVENALASLLILRGDPVWFPPVACSHTSERSFHGERTHARSGARRLEQELDRLKTVELPQVLRDIETAREHGDLSENAEYHAAKERLGMIAARITFIEQTLSRAEIIDVTKVPHDGKVTFGSTVTVENTAGGETQTLRLVGPEEADIKEGLVSIASPLARGIIARAVGDTVKVTMPAGVREFKILKVEYI